VERGKGYFSTMRAAALGELFAWIFKLTKTDRWFLVQIKEIVDLEEERAGAEN